MGWLRFQLAGLLAFAVIVSVVAERTLRSAFR